jgi:hypothetical protein
MVKGTASVPLRFSCMGSLGRSIAMDCTILGTKGIYANTSEPEPVRILGRQ